MPLVGKAIKLGILEVRENKSKKMTVLVSTNPQMKNVLITLLINSSVKVMNVLLKKSKVRLPKLNLLISGVKRMLISFRINTNQLQVLALRVLQVVHLQVQQRQQQVVQLQPIIHSCN